MSLLFFPCNHIQENGQLIRHTGLQCSVTLSTVVQILHRPVKIQGAESRGQQHPGIKSCRCLCYIYNVKTLKMGLRGVFNRFKAGSARAWWNDALFLIVIYEYPSLIGGKVEKAFHYNNVTDRSFYGFPVQSAKALRFPKHEGRQVVF